MVTNDYDSGKNKNYNLFKIDDVVTKVFNYMRVIRFL